jgi:molybdenum cofactor cytidylyltransferase
MVCGIHHPSVVVLAAGRSARLGRPKQLVSKDGSTLLRRALSAACAADIGPVYAILGCHAESMKNELAGLPVKAVFNDRWEEGIASSIRCGLQQTRSDNPDTDGILVMVCDQPAVEADTLKCLLAIREKADAPLAACSYGGTRGIPALFHSSLFDELGALNGDAGAKGVIERHRDEAVFLDFPGGDADIDTEAECDDWLSGETEKKEA